ncbi:diguanylate cyclase [Aliikangiella marina]|uniref:diguanylate cyclase n=1 Tax=Aliikangiella marina TaxID=1712262 RepID=A0A545T388_9GAMM|nr:diguanylate cyclase [Aliikangiella marina]TQV71667.1 diguanylate cyclase [Aliikangiella marina]TQV71682.1 diguanylate cyclase [Aliikangiella marina]
MIAGKNNKKDSGAASKASSKRSLKPKILIAEKDTAIQGLLASQINLQYCESFTINDGDELTQQLIINHIDLLFLSDSFIEVANNDVHPQTLMNKLAALIKRIKIVSADTRIIVISSKSSQNSIPGELMEAGISDYFSLAIGEQRFLAAVSSSLELLVAKSQAKRTEGQNFIEQTLSSYKRPRRKTQNNQFINRLIRNIPGNVLLVDKAHKIIVANTSCEQFLGYGKKALNGQFIKDLFSPKLYSEVSAGLSEVTLHSLDQINEKDFESIVITYKGEGVPVRCFMRPMQFSGQPGYVLTLQDITHSLDDKASHVAQLKWQHHLNEFAKRFISLPVNEFSKVIKELLQTSAHFMGCERVYIYRLDNARRAATLSYEWSADKETLKTFSRNIPIYPDASEFQSLAECRPLLLTPKYNVKIKQITENLGLSEHLATVDAESSFIVPLSHKSQVYGWVGFDIQRTGRHWQNEDMQNIEELAKVINQAIVRKKYEEMRQSTHLKLIETHGKLSEQAYLDSLTKIANRRYFDQVLRTEIGRAARENSHLSIMLCDIDNFKDYNDTYGHLGGDQCLQKVARTLESSFQRAADFVARFGGEEFVVILPGLDMRGAFEAADRMRRLLYEMNIPHTSSPLGRLTISIGLTSVKSPAPESASELIEKSDRALYRAKYRGKNRVYAYTKKPL